MVKVLEFSGTKKEIARQIEQESGQILNVMVVIEDGAPAAVPNDTEFKKLMDELDAMTVEAPHVDYSREAMYTRMPGE